MPVKMSLVSHWPSIASWTITSSRSFSDCWPSRSRRGCSAAARAIGQPAVLGELLAGVILGGSVLGLIEPGNHDRSGTLLLDFLSEVGVVILLFEIGLETDFVQLLRVGLASMAVTITGVTLSFAAGYLVCRCFGLDNRVCIVAGAALTATSVGITARVLNDLGRLHAPESQIVLGAAVIDDILGLIILTVISGLAEKRTLAAGEIALVAGKAFGFLVVVLAVGAVIIPPLVPGCTARRFPASSPRWPC